MSAIAIVKLALSVTRTICENLVPMSRQFKYTCITPITSGTNFKPTDITTLKVSGRENTMGRAMNVGAAHEAKTGHRNHLA